MDRGSRGRSLALHLQHQRIIIRWNLAVWRVIYQSHKGFTSLVWHRCEVEGRELIPPRVWLVQITCTSHLWWPPEWKIKYSVPVLPPVISWPLGREGKRKKGNGKWKKCFCPCSDFIKELREQLICSVRMHCSKYGQPWNFAHVHTFSYTTSRLQTASAWGHRTVKLKEEMTNFC